MKGGEEDQGGGREDLQWKKMAPQQHHLNGDSDDRRLVNPGKLGLILDT